jgi:2-hydroxy-6-oxonona-2,4-dienedioate hydrolase
MTGFRRRYLIGSILGLAVIGSLLWVYAAYQRDLQRAQSRIALGSQVAQTACGPIEFASVGSGPAVLMVHGAGGGFDQGLDFGTQLAEAGFRVVSMSRFGYLRTPLPADASAAAQADAHACLLDYLKIPRAAIIGASAGAPSSMQFALRHPDRCTALVLLVPAAYVPRPDNAPPMTTPAWTEFLFDTALKSDFVFWAAIRLAGPTVTQAILATPPDVLRRAAADEQARAAKMLGHILPVSPRRLGLLNDARVTSTLGRYALERIGTPALAISMKDDLFGTYDGAQYSAQHIPRARFVGYPSGGHLWIGHHREVMAEIAGFLREPERGGQ